MTLPLAIRRRRWALVALVAAVVVYGVIARFNVRLTYTAATGVDYDVGFQAALLEVGYDASAWRNSNVTGWRLEFLDYSWLRADSWRPYHRALGPMPRKSPYHYLVVPLWYFPVAAIGYVCFAHGVVRGVRHGAHGAALNACVRCGYELGKLPGARADRMCPECGARQGGSPSARREEGESAAVVEVKLPVGEVAAARGAGLVEDARVPHSGQGDVASRPDRE